MNDRADHNGTPAPACFLLAGAGVPHQQTRAAPVSVVMRATPMLRRFQPYGAASG